VKRSFYVDGELLNELEMEMFAEGFRRTDLKEI
jgi:hypothetical protein